MDGNETDGILAFFRSADDLVGHDRRHVGEDASADWCSANP